MPFLKLTNINEFPVIQRVENLASVQEIETINSVDHVVSMYTSTPERRAEFGWREELVTKPAYDARVEKLVIASEEITSPTQVTTTYAVEDLPIEDAQRLTEQAVISRWVQAYDAGTTSADGHMVPTNGNDLGGALLGGVTGYLMVEMLTRRGDMTLPTGLPLLYPAVAGDVPVENMNLLEFDNALASIGGHYQSCYTTGKDKVVATRQATTINDLRAVIALLDDGWPPVPQPPTL